MKKSNKGIVHQMMEATPSEKPIKSEFMDAFRESVFSTERVNTTGYAAMYIEGALVENRKGELFVTGPPATEEQRAILKEWADGFLNRRPT